MKKSELTVAGLVSAEDRKRPEGDRAERFSVIDEMRAAFKDVPPAEIERAADRTLAEVRAEREETGAPYDTEGV